MAREFPPKSSDSAKDAKKEQKLDYTPNPKKDQEIAEKVGDYLICHEKKEDDAKKTQEKAEKLITEMTKPQAPESGIKKPGKNFNPLAGFEVIKNLLKKWFNFDWDDHFGPKLKNVIADPDDYDDEKFDDYDEKKQKNVTDYRHASNKFFEKSWDKITQEYEGKLTSENLSELLDKYSSGIKTDWEANKRNAKEKELNNFLARVNEFKEAFNNQSDQKTKNKVIDWIKKGDLSSALLSKETIEALKIGENLDDETNKMINQWPYNQFRKYLPYIILANKKYDVPIPAMLELMKKEGSGGNPYKKAPGSSALGLGQMINSTWSSFKEPGWDRFNPLHQILAMSKYLKYLKDKKDCEWKTTLAYYNTGEGGVSWKNLNTYVRLNPSIASKMGGKHTPSAYLKAATQFYSGDSPVDLAKFDKKTDAIAA